jgi:predicted metalloprotease with PDZ domain
MIQSLTLGTERPALSPTSAIRYLVAMPQPASHLFEVTVQVEQWQGDRLDLKMPVWTPGSYLVREYARLVQDFTAVASDTERQLPCQKLAKNHWQIETQGVPAIAVRYRVFANELTVRTNHLDASHGYLNGAATFCFVPGLERQPTTVTIVPPQADWQVLTALPPAPGQSHTYRAKDFDTLVDSPFEIGTHTLYDFESEGKPHQLAIWGQGNAKPSQIIEDTQKIIGIEAKIFGGLPYDRYFFLLHLTNNGFGGLEHKDCCSLIYSRFGFNTPAKYQRFLQLVAHEFFHLWNVKRLRPKEFESFDYERENYTPSLWFCEGVTSYYDMLIPLWAGIYDGKTFLELLGKEISQYLAIPGRKVQSLTESSLDAWIKLYRRDANSNNCQISYYLKGQLVALLLDLLVRSRSQNQRSLNDVLRKMWQQFGRDEIGYTAAELQSVLESEVGIGLQDFYDRYLHGIEELPFNEYLYPFGLELKANYDDIPLPFLGLRLQNEGGKAKVQFVEAGSPAAIAGLDPGDELLAIDGIRVTAEQLNERLQDYRGGDIIQICFFHQDRLLTASVHLASPQPSRYEIVRLPNCTERQKQNLAGWLSFS